MKLLQQSPFIGTIMHLGNLRTAIVLAVALMATSLTANAAVSDGHFANHLHN